MPLFFIFLFFEVVFFWVVSYFGCDVFLFICFLYHVLFVALGYTSNITLGHLLYLYYNP